MELTFRPATAEDLFDIVQMLSDDALGAVREKVSDELYPGYIKAFERIKADSNQELTIVEMNGEKVGTFQLTFIQYLTHQGGIRAQVEAVRIRSQHRGKGIGKKVFDYILNRARQKSCFLVQLTTDKKRTEALHFYESLGFSATHEGMKLIL